MHRILLLGSLFLLLLAGCAKQHQAVQSGPDSAEDSKNSTSELPWQLLTDSADLGECFYELFSIHDTLWTMCASGNWYSVDGKVWERALLPDALGNLAFYDYVVFKDGLYGLGKFGGVNYDNGDGFLHPYVQRTTDMRRWEMLANEGNLPPQTLYHPYAYDGYLWIMGGRNDTADIDGLWRSADGVQWEQVVEAMPFGPRSDQRFVTFKDRVWMIDHDVWSSADGVEWSLETQAIVPGYIYGQAVLATEDHIWVFSSHRGNKFVSEIYRSSDGRNWEVIPAPWTPKGLIVACLHKGAIIVAGPNEATLHGNRLKDEYWRLELD